MSQPVFFDTLRWYEGPETPDGGVWPWAVEHAGHPAYYLRALMPGDFAPGQAGPLSRHVLAVDGTQMLAEPVCGTCEQLPKPEDLEPIERATGQGGFLAQFRLGRARWPRATPPGSCWECSNPRERVAATVELGKLTVRTCQRCAGYLARREVIAKRRGR